MKFDVIIGNPPYQLEDGGHGASASAIYNLFIDVAIDLNPKYITMIIPSRWMVGGKGLNKFRAEMINNGKFKIIHDYENSQELFPNVGVNGGINYFLWDKDHKGEVEYFFHKKNGEVKRSNRKLKNKISEYVIRNNEDATLIENIFKRSKNFFSDIVSSGDPYGFRTDAFNKKDIGLSNEKSDFNCIMFGVKKTKRTHMYVDKKYITKNKDNIDKFKLFFPSVFGTETTLLPEIIIGEKDSICTGSFIEIGPFNDKIELENCLKYMRTKFFRYLFHVNKYSYGISKRTFSLIPLQDFSKSWTDEKLYKKYKLTQEEIDYIEDNIAPMPTSDD